MHPGQIQPNELEVAILRNIAAAVPSINDSLRQLHVLSREFTGVGSFTKFNCSVSDAERHVTLGGLIRVPGVPNGLGAVLWLKGNYPVTLEIYAFGDELWEGTYEGFSIEGAV